MNPVVPASYAQFGVGAVGRRRFLRLRKKGGLQWHGDNDPSFAETGYCAEAYSLVVIDFCTKLDVNLHCGVKHWMNAVCSVACLA